MKIFSKSEEFSIINKLLLKNFNSSKGFDDGVTEKARKILDKNKIEYSDNSLKSYIDGFHIGLMEQREKAVEEYNKIIKPILFDIFKEFGCHAESGKNHMNNLPESIVYCKDSLKDVIKYINKRIKEKLGSYRRTNISGVNFYRFDLYAGYRIGVYDTTYVSGSTLRVYLDDPKEFPVAFDR